MPTFSSVGDDDGGRNGTAIPAANTKENNLMRKLRRKREKGARAFLVRHTSNVLMHDKMAEPPPLPCLEMGSSAGSCLRHGARCRPTPRTSMC